MLLDVRNLCYKPSVCKYLCPLSVYIYIYGCLHVIYSKQISIMVVAPCFKRLSSMSSHPSRSDRD